MNNDDKLWTELRRTQEEYYDGYVDQFLEFARSYARSWFESKEHMLNFYRFSWDDRQLMAADVAWDLSEMENQ